MPSVNIIEVGDKLFFGDLPLSCLEKLNDPFRKLEGISDFESI